MEYDVVVVGAGPAPTITTSYAIHSLGREITISKFLFLDSIEFV